MQLSISGQHLEITDALHKHVTMKIEKITKHFDYVKNTHVVLHVEKTRHIAEATVNTKGAVIHASSEEEDMYSAIDSMVHKLTRQIRKHKEKCTDHHKSKTTVVTPR